MRLCSEWASNTRLRTVTSRGKGQRIVPIVRNYNDDFTLPRFRQLLLRALKVKVDVGSPDELSDRILEFVDFLLDKLEPV